MAILIPPFLNTFFSALTRLWSAVFNFLRRHHLLFFFTIVYLTTRVGLLLSASLFATLHKFVMLYRVSVQSGAAHTSGLNLLSAFSIVNAMFPVHELFVFLLTILQVKSACMLYATLRSLYKNIPLKST